MGLVAALVVARLVPTLISPDHLGVDGGSYLVGLNQLRGVGETNTAFERLPLGPGWLLYPFVTLFGVNAGYKVWAAVFSAFPLVPIVYLFARQYISARASLCIAAAAGLNIWVSMLHVTGASVTLALSLLLLAMWGIRQLALGRPKWGAAALLVSIPLIAFSSNTVSGIAAFTLPVWAIWYRKEAVIIAYRTQTSYFRTLAAPVLVASGIAALALPWYIGTLTNGRFHYPGPLLLPGAIDDQGFYLGIAALMSAWFFLGVRTRYQVLRVIGWLVLMHGTMVFWWSYHEAVMNVLFRSRHWVTLLATIGFGIVLSEHWRAMPRQRIVATVLAGVVLGGGAWAYMSQEHYSRFMSADLERGVRYAEEHSTGGAWIMGNLAEATWAQALTGNRIYHAADYPPPPHYAAIEPHIRCVLNWAHPCDIYESVRVTNAEFIITDTRFPSDPYRLYRAPELPWQKPTIAPWTELVYWQGSVRVWRILPSMLQSA